VHFDFGFIFLETFVTDLTQGQVIDQWENIARNGEIATSKVLKKETGNSLLLSRLISDQYLPNLITLVKNSKKQLYEKNINLNFLTYCDDNLYQ
jgi:hypothetical protein